MNNEELYAQLKAILVDQFELDESAITPDADLYDRLELDSIDAVDLMVQLKKITGKRFHQTHSRMCVRSGTFWMP